MGHFSSRNDRRDDTQSWMSKLMEYKPQVPLIVAGDFNEHATCKVGSYLRSQNMEDAISTNDSSITWKWPLLNGWVNLWGRYDHIFYSTDKLHCQGGRVIQAGASDHFPVVAD